MKTGRHLYTGGGTCNWVCRVFCFLNIHRWSWPGGYCECCGKRDWFFDREGGESDGE